MNEKRIKEYFNECFQGLNGMKLREDEIIYLVRKFYLGLQMIWLYEESQN